MTLKPTVRLRWTIIYSTRKICQVALSLRSIVHWCSETSEKDLGLTIKTTRRRPSPGGIVNAGCCLVAACRGSGLGDCPSADGDRAEPGVRRQNSVTRSAPVNSDSQGRCGARFLTTYDRRFVIKAVSSEDVAEMHNILKKYHQFIVECHGNTLLPQFLGMYRLTVDGVETYMVVTRNVFSHRLTVHRKYDLKAKDLPTFKDNDFLNEGQKLHVGEESKKNFLEKLKRDVEFLAQLKIMDYSLLVGIHDVDRAEQEEMEVEDRAEDEECENDGLGGNPISSYGTPPDSPGNLLNYPRFFGPGEFDPSVDVYAMKSHESAPKKEVYFMAIIDILTPYDAKKKAAHAAKTVKHGAGAEISTVNPEQYSKRFNEFISNILT
ncbi:phosphatidylinositol 5-phosphate 4-kinase type-2 beta isoform X2 [Egretta garzetta]|uniref:phosphatidylinositol 5-phosphate 4-kinase type-2 beta isoform X2 n=1 Tax=Egretta garzetta TaxID=188379 RepID=UPI00163BC79A|nr:phosphatidylinositol 5-phosphate 4-kinase type-2 beta isoform X2 [Egretta garzetta]